MMIMRLLKNLIKRITSISPTYDQGLAQYVQATYMGKPVTTQVLHDYGFVSSPPPGSLGICINPRAEENDKASTFFHPKYSFYGLLPGETVIGNFVLKSSLYFNAQGQGILTLPGDLIITCNNLTATVLGNVTETVAGNVTSTVAGDTTLTTNNLTATMTGVTTMTSSAFNFYGPATFYNGIAVLGAMTINGVSMDENHVHLPGTYVAGTVAVTNKSGIVDPTTP